DKEIKDAMPIILSYSEAPASTVQVFEKLVADYAASPDKTETTDEMRKLRKEISRIFYDLYYAIFMKTLDDKTPPLEVKMFLLFGFIDENLAGKENTAILANFARQWKSDPAGRIVTIRDWLKLIYEMKVNPSKNEFDSDYLEYLKEQVTGGYITREEEAAFKNDRTRRLKFEIENFFTMGNRLTFGRVTTFVPIFTEDAVLRPLRTALLTPEKVKTALDSIRETDFSLFYRDSVTAFEDLEINQFLVSKEVLPYVILMPNMGSRTSMWQEIDGKKRDTPARMMMSILFTEDLDEAMTKLCGEFRWEMCRRIQGVHWNDVTDPSLTSEYCDYMQFYRKNHDISPESREKIKLALQKARNNYRTVFVADYMVYIRSEATGSARLNKISRGIVFRYCPFRSEKREAMRSNPLYGDLIEKYGIKQQGKIHLIQVMIQKIKKMGKETPDTILKQLEYIKT
ncbi:MAG: cyclic nucleotide-binding domain-containing protein, partial [Lachnospiraceae bacterium]|nr:cyclic nucleotide-binding domain-containing protein [Lachnospiraceae bacterium]